MDWWDAFKTLLQFVIVPCIAGLFFFVKKSDNKFEEVEKRLARIENNHSVLEERVTNMRTDLKEIKDMLRQLLNKN